MQDWIDKAKAALNSQDFKIETFVTLVKEAMDEIEQCRSLGATMHGVLLELEEKVPTSEETKKLFELAWENLRAALDPDLQ